MTRATFPYWKDLVTIGKCIKPHGLDGEMKVKPVTDFPERFYETENVFAHRREDPVHPLQIETVRPHQNGFLVRFSGYGDLASAEQLRGMTLAVWEDELVELEDDEYWHWQLEGLRAVDSCGQEFGTLKEVVSSLAHDLYVVEDLNGKTHLVPAVRQYVPEIDLLRGRATIILPIWLDE